jgi:hypothetical protein
MLHSFRSLPALAKSVIPRWDAMFEDTRRTS